MENEKGTGQRYFSRRWRILLPSPLGNNQALAIGIKRYAKIGRDTDEGLS